MTGARFSRAGAQADHVADGVDADVEPERLHPAHDQIAADLVFVGERQPGAAAAFDGADSGQFIQRAEQAPFIEPQHDFPNGAKTLDCCSRQGKISRRGDPDCLATAWPGGHLLGSHEAFACPSPGVAHRWPGLRPGGRADRQCPRRAFGRRGGGEAGRAVLGRPAPDHPAEVAYLLEEPRRIRPADRDQMDPAARREGRAHRLAGAASLRYRRRHQLRFPGRGRAAGSHHAARRSRHRPAETRRRSQLAGVRRRLHPRGRQVRALPAGDGDRRTGAARDARDLRQGAPERADGRARGPRATASPSRAIRR